MEAGLGPVGLSSNQGTGEDSWGQGKEGMHFPSWRINLFINDTAASLVFRLNLCHHLHLYVFCGRSSSSQTQTALNAGQRQAVEKLLCSWVTALVKANSRSLKSQSKQAVSAEGSCCKGV